MPQSICLPPVSLWHVEVFKTEALQKSDDKINGSYDSVNKYLENAYSIIIPRYFCYNIRKDKM
jgi:hypothetical protein